MTSHEADDRTAATLAAIPDQESLTGIFVSQSGPRATVQQGRSTLTVLAATQYPLLPGDPVRLERRDGQLIMLGPAVARSGMGKIVATGTPKATVEYPPGSGVTAQMLTNASVTFAVNDVVLLSWDVPGGAVVCKLSSTPTAPPPDPTPPPIPTTYRQQFDAIDSGTFDGSRWWTRDVYCSNTRSGAYFYGSKIRDTIPDAAQILGARIYLPPPKQASGAAPNLGRHGSETKPGGAVAVAAAGALGARSGWVDIPLALLDYLKANPGGIGFTSGGYHIWAGVDADGLSGSLDVTYRL